MYTIFGYNISTLGNTKLGLLEKTGVINIITRNNPMVLNDNGFKIGIEAQEYHSHIDENMSEDFKIFNLNVDYNILITHSMLLEYKFHENVRHTLIKDVTTSADLVLAGHYHDGWKEREQDGTWFFNPGSFLRMEASTAMINAMPKVLVFEIDNLGNLTYEYKFLPSAVKGNKVFSSKNLVKKLYNTGLEDFHNKLKSQRFKGVNIVDLIDVYTAKNPLDTEASEYAKEKINEMSVTACDNGYTEEQDNIYIEKVELVNFQIHSKKTVNFTNGLNVIIGESNAGKTAILRGIYWCLYDKPSGSDFIKSGSKSCKVTIHLSNGYKVERKRTKTSSGTYTITSPDGVVSEFKGFSNNIPIEVLNSHQMPEIKINGTGYKFNVATQLEAPFLIGNSPTERLSLIGALVDADRADSAKKNINATRRKNNLERNQIAEFKSNKEEELKKYNHLEKMKRDIDIIELIIDRIELSEEKLINLEKLYDNYYDLSVSLNEINERLNNISIPNRSYIDELKESIDKASLLENIKFNYDSFKLDIYETTRYINDIPDTKSIKNDLELLNDLLSKVDVMSSVNSEYMNNKGKLNNLLAYEEELNVDAKGIRELLNQLQVDLTNANELKEADLSLDKSMMSIHEVELQLHNLDKEINSLNTEREEKLSSLQGIEETCKYCGSVIDINKILGGN